MGPHLASARSALAASKAQFSRFSRQKPSLVGQNTAGPLYVLGLGGASLLRAVEGGC